MDQKIKKIIPYFFVTLIILAGLFGSAGNARAQAVDPIGTCALSNPTRTVPASSTYCKQLTPTGQTPQWTPPAAAPAGTPAAATGSCYTTNAPPASTGDTKDNCTGAGKVWVDVNGGATNQTSAPASSLKANMASCDALDNWTFNGCIEKIFYIIFYGIPAWLLTLSAKFFDALIAITLSSKLFAASTFIPVAWGVVRDLSNLFFILILLYIAIQIILDLGHDAKKMIVKVIIIALLINFSMFFTEVVIDSSNILALVFYNKLNVDTKNLDGSTSVRPYIPVTNADNEKDIAGGMVSAFDPSQFLTQDFFDKAKQKTQATPPGTIGTIVGTMIPVYGLYQAYGYWFPSEEVPVPMIIGIILISGLIMSFAAYTFFIAGISFLGRLIELWVLIIFSPFAFMSSTVPILDKVDYIGWDAWLKRLLAVAFMAPIFMFFMYFIFLLIKSNLFGNLGFTSDKTITGSIETMILVIIPAMIILILLMKATDFAKKGSGKLGEALMTGVKMVGGLALGATVGGA